MFDIHRVELDWGGRKLTLETGRVARQADGAVLATYGETTVLATVVAAKQPKEGIDFLPLTVNYTEKYYAAGKIPGGYFKREGRPTEKETLTSRLIDRPIRPLFVDGWRCDTQVIVTVLSHDMENDPDIVGDGRRLRRADALRRALHGPDRRRPRRLHRRRVRAQSDDRRDDGKPARPRRRRHPRRRDDGRIGSQGAVRGDHAGRGDVRPPALPAGDRGDHQARREGRQGAVRSGRPRPQGAGKGNSRARREGSARRLFDREEAGPPGRRRRRQTKGDGALLSGRRRADLRQARGCRRVQGAGSQDRALEHPRHQQAHRRPRPEDRAPDRGGSRRAAAHPRLGAVHPRRDPGAGGRHARHRRGRAVHRRAAGDVQRDVPAALQLPALLGRRDRPHGRAGPARDRPRQAGLARDPPDAADRGRVPLHHPRRLGDHRVRTARRRWRRSAAPRWR